jgi:hypothetical protein
MLISVARDDPAPTKSDAWDDSLLQQRVDREPSDAQSAGDVGDGHSIAGPLCKRRCRLSGFGVSKWTGNRLLFSGAVHNCLAFRTNAGDESSCAQRAQKRKRETNMTNEETTKTAGGAEQGAHVAPQKGTLKKVATKKKGAPKGQKTAKGAKSTKAGKKAAKSGRKAASPRPESKGALILALIRRPKGATLAELAKLTGWQNHSIRGFLSGTVGRKMGLTVESAKREDGERVYSLKK